MMNDIGKAIFPAIFFLLLPLFCGCEKREVVFTGRTMGTTYTVKVVCGRFDNTAGLDSAMGKRLAEIEGSMSVYRPDSEISRFNRFKRVGEGFPVSGDFAAVMARAARVFRLTEGAWDGTVKPLIDLWGFGAGGRRDDAPDPQEIERAMATAGFDRIRLVDGPMLVKSHGAAGLNLGSIAKGYAVDEMVKLLKTAGFGDCLVEIGGELGASGKRGDGGPWRAGVNLPVQGAATDEFVKVVELFDAAMATSGDYRNFFEKGGRRYSHIIDPRNGGPVSNNVVSVSVIAGSCALADGLATGIMVMGKDRGLDTVRGLKDVECFIVTDEDGVLKGWSSR